MQFVTESIDHVTDDISWLGSQHGTEAIGAVTVDLSNFTQATHAPDGYIKSGNFVSANYAGALWDTSRGPAIPAPTPTWARSIHVGLVHPREGPREPSPDCPHANTKAAAQAAGIQFKQY